MRFLEHVQSRLEGLERDQLLRHPRIVDGAQDAIIQVDGRPALSLCSNNYLGLANHPSLIEAAQRALASTGTSSGASRHVSGSERHHLLAQTRLAQLVGLPSALLFSSGYAANVGALQAVLGPEDVVFSDAFNHASLIDGCRLARARVCVYPHRDYDALEELLHVQRPAGRAALIATDAVFSMDGARADLVRLRELADRFEAGLLVDEAHSLGLLGPRGAGLCAEVGIRPDLLTGMLGKACGAMGGFVAGAAKPVGLVENRARSYVFSTAPPPMLAAVAAAAVELVQAADDRRRRVFEVAGALREGLSALGYRTLGQQTPIVPVVIGEPGPTMALSAALLERGVFVHGIRPPTVPVGTSRLRVTAMASHTDGHVQQALSAFADVLNDATLAFR